METEERLNLCAEINRQKEIIQEICKINNEVIKILFNVIPTETEIKGETQESCLQDTIQNNTQSLLYLERVSAEIAKRIIG